MHLVENDPTMQRAIERDAWLWTRKRDVRELPLKTSVNRQKLPAIIKTARTFLRVGRETAQRTIFIQPRSVFNPSVQTKSSDTFDPVERVLNNYF